MSGNQKLYTISEVESVAMKDELSVYHEMLYRTMYLIRTVEKSLLDLFSQGHLNGTVHTCIGQEACSVGVLSGIDKSKDIVFSNHRGHGHYLSYSGDVKGLIAEIMGKPQGVCSGLGGSQHLQINNLYTNGIQGAGVPIVAGMAFAEKRKGSGAIVVEFVGDGTFGEGAVYEGLNIMSLWKLPVLLVVEDNQYAQTTPKSVQHAGDLSTRGNTFAIKTTVVDGMDVLKVREAAEKLIQEIRTNSEPQILYLQTYRFAPHSKGDDFRDAAEIAMYKKRDPLTKLLQSNPQINDKAIEQDVDAYVKDIIQELLN